MPKTYTVKPINELSWYLTNGTRCLNAIDFMADGKTYHSTDSSVVEIMDCYAANSPPHLVTDFEWTESIKSRGGSLKETIEHKEKIFLADYVWSLVWKHKQKPRHGFWKKWNEEKLEYLQPGVDKSLQDTAIWLPIDEFSYQNPWHIWIDQISKLVLLYYVYGDKFWQWPFIIPYKNKYIEETFKILNPDAKLIHMPKKEYWHCDHLIVPTVTNVLDGVVHPLAVRYLRQTLNRFIGAPTKKLFISRKNAKLRHIENETKVIKLIQKYGYEVVYPEKLSVEEQLKLFGQASHIIGAHGAGLTNMIVSPKDCYIIELYHKDRDKKVYPILARHCEHNMTRIQCKSVPVSVQEKSNTKLKDQVNLVVNTQQLETFLR